LTEIFLSQKGQINQGHAVTYVDGNELGNSLFDIANGFNFYFHALSLEM